MNNLKIEKLVEKNGFVIFSGEVISRKVLITPAFAMTDEYKFHKKMKLSWDRLKVPKRFRKI